MSYRAPTDEMRFVLDTVVGLDRILALPGFEEVTPDLVDAVLAEAARLAETAIAPLDEEGDRNPPVLGEGGVRTSPAFGRAYAAFRDGGWNAVPFPQAIGGQGLPWSVAFAVQEMWQSASMAFGLCPLLNQAAIELLATHADPALRERFLPRLVSGEWTGTMDLTEPQAGSDLGAIRTLATPRPDGSFALSGGKIFITWGDHDLSSNILHLVLARTPDAPAGSRGLSLFLVPKILPDGRANDLRCIGLERKLGIHGSPTCAMRYGEAEDGATGWLVGVPQGGIAAMFTMMNNARLSVGLQGVAIGDRALQRARAYAAERVQGRGLLAAAGESILGHPDIRRMLAEMRARIEAAR
jgi:alkylation response protein AidB-like acyl-CoA dehydrogenase